MGSASKPVSTFGTTSTEAPNFYSQISNTFPASRKWMFEFQQSLTSGYRHSSLCIGNFTLHFFKDFSPAKMTEQPVDKRSRYVLPANHRVKHTSSLCKIHIGSTC